MIKYYLIAMMMILLSALISCRQNRIDGKGQKADDSSALMLLDSSILDYSKLSPFDSFIKKYADSVNHIKTAEDIPVFVSNPQFDYESAGMWSPSHHPLPLRFMIFEKVNNCDALKVLLQTNNHAYKVKPQKKYDIDVEYIQLSFYDLAFDRYKRLQCVP
jgi:hypothetical protein